MEHENRPLFGRQPPEAAVEQVPIGNGQQVIRSGRPFDREDAEVGCSAALTRRLGQADMDQQALEPRIEPVRIAEPTQVTPGDHQRVLQGVLGPIDVAEDPLGDRKEAVASNADQVDEGLPIPAPRCLDEIPIHRIRLSGIRWGCLPNLLVAAEGLAFNPASASRIRRGDWTARLRAYNPRSTRQARALEVAMEIYPWVILLHIIGAFMFAASHGVAIWMAMVLSRERDRTRMAALLDLSSASLGGVYVGLVLLLIGGIWGGLIGNWFASLWIWAALVLLIAIAVIMYMVATPYFRSLRDAIGIKSQYGPKDAPDPVPLPDAELIALAARSPVVLLSVVGVGGLVIILWLMVVKPF